ncbi:hypothetical protein SBC1_48460 (plasmid) [Caballeronia sp. SBC1]|nr:hypothetical protein SBC2_39510 [Caballeronia sp. SBC2]QIN64806.1 hypothetical protein SBC1_48460 [Caballeronia sp. SBC1]
MFLSFFIISTPSKLVYRKPRTFLFNALRETHYIRGWF